MSITSLIFFGACGLAVLIYWRLPASQRVKWLFVTSLGFLVSWSWGLACIMLIMATTNHRLGRWLALAEARRRVLLWIGIGFNITVLLGLKYSSFYSASLVNLLDKLGIATRAGGLNLLVPVGLSFVVLQMISYLVDVHKRTLVPEDSWLVFTTYTIYFPKLLSGPIERARTILPAIKNPEKPDTRKSELYLWLVVIGLARKLILADTLAMIVPDETFGQPEFYTGQHLAVSILAYAFMIYNDFAGYTSIVRGVSGLFGIELTNNFKLPYFARNFTEFWNRWHISLSTWLRDYIFFPSSRLLLKNVRKREHVLNLVIPPIVTMLVSGMWHGLSWHFIAWGGLHGIYLILEHVPMPWKHNQLPSDLPKWRQLASITIVFILVVLAWIPFSMDLSTAWKYLTRLFSPTAWTKPDFWALTASLTGVTTMKNWWKFGIPDIRVFALLIPAVFLDWYQHHTKNEVFILEFPVWLKAFILALLGWILVLLSLAESGTPFIYQGF
jgi:alginate O-acetyltransferase complex protein AlgI